MRLTDEQRGIVTENHALIKWCIEYKNLDVEDWYGLFAIELCKAVVTYDEEKGSLSNYYKTFCDNRVCKEFIRLNRKKNKMFKPHKAVNQNEWEHIYPDNNTYYDLQNEVALRELLDDELLLLRYSGYSQKEIAMLMGLSQSYVCKMISARKEVSGEYFMK